MLFNAAFSKLCFVAELLTIYGSDHLDLTDTRGLYCTAVYWSFILLYVW